jgi:hypothetical protein
MDGCREEVKEGVGEGGLNEREKESEAEGGS